MQAAEGGHRLANPPRELEQLDPLVEIMRRENDLLGAVGGGVEREDDFVVQIQAAQDGRDVGEKFGNISLFLEHGHDH